MTEMKERIWEIDNLCVEGVTQFIRANGGIVYKIYNDVHFDKDDREVVTVHFKGYPYPTLREWMRLRKISDEEERIENLRWFARMMTC